MDPELAENVPRFVGRGSVLAAGIALVVWGVLTPTPFPYLLGLLLTAVAVALLLRQWLQLRWKQTHSGYPSRQRRRRTAMLAGLVGLCLIVVGAGGPWAARHHVVDSGMKWQADHPHGSLVPVGENVHVVGWPNWGSDENTVSVVDTRDGSIVWGAPGKVYLTHDGGILSLTEDVVSRYDEDGNRRWESTIPVGEHETLRVLAERDGHAILATCGSDNEGQPDELSCLLSGVDPSGNVTWQRTLDGPGIELSLIYFSEVDAKKHLGPVPAAAVFYDDATPIMIDPATGDNIGSIPEREAASQLVGELYGDRLLVATNTEEDCRLAGYSLEDGSRIWRTDLSCSTSLGLFQVGRITGYAFVTAYERESEDRFFTVDMADGTARELSLSEFGGDDIDVTDDGRQQVSTATAGNLQLTWNGPEVTASLLTNGEERWQVTVPGDKVEHVTGDASTVVIVTEAGSGHNPFLPPDPDDPPEHVTIVQADTGEILSSTLFPHGTRRLVVTAPGQVYVQGPDGATLLASD